MDHLPQEIINRMVIYLDRYSRQEQEGIPLTGKHSGKSSALPSYATISKQWKEAVEFVTFHRLDVRSEDLSLLRTIVTPNRCKYVRRLSYKILLPEYSEEQGKRMETIEEQEANNEVFTQSIVDLLSILRQWEEAGLLPDLRLFLQDPQSPSDCNEFERRLRSTYLALSKIHRIPTVSSVSYLQINGGYRRTTLPTVGLQLAAFLPNLKHIYGEFAEVGEQITKTKMRSTFAKVFEQTKLLRGSAAEFGFYQEAPMDQRTATFSLLPPGALYDPLSASLRVFSENLTSFVLDAYVDATLFWPSSHETCPTPSWPSLKKLKIAFNPVAPSGDWYFVGTPEEDDDEQFLKHGNPNTMDPFLTAFAKATQQMPVLDTFMLECEIGYGIGFWELSYYAPGVKADWSGDWGDEDTTAVRRLYYTVGEVWRPDWFVAETLRSIGQEKHGSEVIERFLGPRSWSSKSAWSWL
ncbi:hypothetical protein EJ02DRAFT_367313 [Clathrospora elynae]|uniref:F-box domain-containing protein n=1 Tax=Clathrospora elynae TaxID=706981 RepID=A0A6A5T2Y9_9PLEO|nr:hypothetical protein EJ02DRAFT_367313 [Clathrospora elynae]